MTLCTQTRSESLHLLYFEVTTKSTQVFFGRKTFMSSSLTLIWFCSWSKTDGCLKTQDISLCDCFTCNTCIEWLSRQRDLFLVFALKGFNLTDNNIPLTLIVPQATQDSCERLLFHLLLVNLRLDQQITVQSQQIHFDFFGCHRITEVGCSGSFEVCNFTMFVHETENLKNNETD